MESDKLISNLKQNKTFHKRLTEIVRLLGIAPDIDTFIQDRCAPSGFQFPYNEVDYKELLDLCDRHYDNPGYLDKGILPIELVAIIFLNFGVPIGAWPVYNFSAYLKSSIPLPQSHRVVTDYYYDEFLLRSASVVRYDQNIDSLKEAQDPHNHIIDHLNIKCIIKDAQKQPPEWEVYIDL